MVLFPNLFVGLQILILEICCIFLRLKFLPFAILEKIPHFWTDTHYDHLFQNPHPRPCSQNGEGSKSLAIMGIAPLRPLLLEESSWKEAAKIPHFGSKILHFRSKTLIIPACPRFGLLSRSFAEKADKRFFPI